MVGGMSRVINPVTCTIMGHYSSYFPGDEDKRCSVAIGGYFIFDNDSKTITNAKLTDRYGILDSVIQLTEDRKETTSLFDGKELSLKVYPLIPYGKDDTDKYLVGANVHYGMGPKYELLRLKDGIHFITELKEKKGDVSIFSGCYKAILELSNKRDNYEIDGDVEFVVRKVDNIDK